jgi:hypothetical protein
MSAHRITAELVDSKVLKAAYSQPIRRAVRWIGARRPGDHEFEHFYLGDELGGFAMPD